MSVTLSRRALSLLTVPYLRNLTYRSSSIDAKKEHNILTNDIACPGWVAENIVGKKGKYISALLKKYPGAAILNSDKANMVQVSCSYKDLKAATTDISNHVKYMIETHSQVLLKIDHNIYDAVVGKKRNLINIASTANVHITIYPKDKDQHFKITGLKDRVENAKEQVLKRAGTMTSTDLEIKRCFHMLLRGKERKIANNIYHNYPEVFVKFPIEPDCNKVLLSGPREDVEQVSILLKKHVQEGLVDVELELEKKYYGLLLGYHGKNMKKLLHTFPNVFITFPDKESNSNKILLCGSREDVEQVSNVIKELISEDIINVELEIEKKHHGFLIGYKGQRIKKIGLDYPQVFITFPDKKVNSNKILLRGSREDVEQVSNLIKELISDDHIINVELEIEKKYHGFLIGYEGQRINKIMLDYPQVVIEFPTERSDCNKVLLSGPHENVEQVSNLLKKHLQEDLVDVELEIQNKYHGMLLGYHGKNMKKLQHTFPNVFITFQDRESSSNKILLCGYREDVEQVSNLIKKQTSEDIINVELEIEKKYRGFLLGYEGQRIKKIRLDYPQVFITFPDRESSSNKILLSGSREDVEQVSNVIKELVVSADIIDVELEIEKKYHEFLLGYEGHRIRKIRLDYPQVAINVPDRETNCNTILLTGSRENVEHVSNLIKELMSEDIIDVELEMEKKYHMFLLGHEGHNIKKMLLDRPQVHVRFPSKLDNEEPGCNKVLIIGSREQVEQVCDILKDSLESCRDGNLYEEAVAIDPKHHGVMIGPNGDNINTLMKKFGYVHVDFNNQSGKIVIKGKKTAVMNMKEGLMSFVREQSHCVAIPVEPFVYNFLNCEDGIRITKLRKEFGVSCFFPSFPQTWGEDTIIIKIIGHLERVDKAVGNLKQQIKQAQNYEAQNPE